MLFRSPPLLEGRYNVIAWFPGHGPWLAGSLEHRLTTAVPHEFRLPQPARLVVQLSLPVDVRPGAVEVFAFVPTLNCFGIGQFGKQNALRRLLPDGERASYSAEVLPGDTRVVVRGASLAELRKEIQIAEGAEKRVHLTPVPGVRTRISLLSPRQPRPGENLRLVARYPEDTMDVSVPPRLQFRTEVGFEVVVWLPLSITELRVFTEQSKQFASLSGSVLEATRTFAAGELQPQEGMPCLTLQLLEVPK